MLVRCIIAAFIGLLLSAVVNRVFRSKDAIPNRRTASMIINAIIMAGSCSLFCYYYGFTYRFIIYTMLTVNLLYISNYDIREQTVSFEMIAAAVVCALAVLIYNKDNIWWNYIVSGIGFTLIFVLVSRLTRGAIGIGDALITGVIGLYLGFYQTLAVIIYALFISGIVSLVLFIMKKVSRQTPLPFAPFLTAGFLVSVLI